MVTMNDEVFLLNDNNGYFHMLAVGTILFRIRFLLYSSSTSWSAILLTPIMMPYSFSIVKWSILEKSYVECTLHGMRSCWHQHLFCRQMVIHLLSVSVLSESIRFLNRCTEGIIYIHARWICNRNWMYFIFIAFTTLPHACRSMCIATNNQIRSLVR